MKPYCFFLIYLYLLLWHLSIFLPCFILNSKEPSKILLNHTNLGFGKGQYLRPNQMQPRPEVKGLSYWNPMFFPKTSVDGVFESLDCATSPPEQITINTPFTPSQLFSGIIFQLQLLPCMILTALKEQSVRCSTPSLNSHHCFYLALFLFQDCMIH